MRRLQCCKIQAFLKPIFGPENAVKKPLKEGLKETVQEWHGFQ